jgi:hypothetical protein
MKRRPKEEFASKSRRSHPTSQTQFAAPRTIEEYFALTAEQQDLYRRSTHAVTQMRAEKDSLPRASGDSGIDAATVLQLAGSALRKSASGRYEAKSSDRLLRVLAIPTLEGVGEIATRDSREASRLATYWDYVQIYLQTGDPAGLEQFEGTHITDANGVQVPLITDLEELDRLGSAGELSFETIYTGAA